MMRGSLCIAVILALVLVPGSVLASYVVTRQHSYPGHHHEVPRTGVEVKAPDQERQVRKQRVKTAQLQVAGSRLPDCSHACGSCSPCRLVTVRFLCSWLAEAETCPLSYKCMCNKKSYPVP